MNQTRNRLRYNRRHKCRQQSKRPPLRLTPYAWAKLLYLRDLGETEVGGFGVSRPGELLLVDDVHLVHQTCSPVTVAFKDESVADYFDDQVDQGRTPEEFARIWVHTHPGESSHPSITDEETFARCFGNADWAIMFIVARGGQTYARLRLGIGPGGEFVLPVEVDFRQAFAASDALAWESEYAATVTEEVESPRVSPLARCYDDTPLRAWQYGEGFADDSLRRVTTNPCFDNLREAFDVPFW